MVSCGPLSSCAARRIFRRPGSADPAAAVGGGSGREPALDSELGHDSPDMAADGTHADASPMGNGTIGQSLGNELEHYPLLIGEPIFVTGQVRRYAERRRAFPEQFEEVPQRGDDDRRAHDQRPGVPVGVSGSRAVV
jgi:hypothetical protein